MIHFWHSFYRIFTSYTKHQNTGPSSSNNLRTHNRTLFIYSDRNEVTSTAVHKYLYTMASYIIPIARISKKVKKLSALYLIIGCLTVAKQVVSFGVTTLATRTRRTLTSTASHQKPRIISLGFSSIPSPLLLAKPSDEENAGYKNNEKQWDDEESLLVMNLSPLPNVSCEDTLSRISQYIRSFPFAAVLPVQPLQALPTDDGGLELKFLRKKTNFKPGVDGGVRFFVKVRDDGENDSIEVILKRNSEGQSIPKMFALCGHFLLLSFVSVY